MHAPPWTVAWRGLGIGRIDAGDTFLGGGGEASLRQGSMARDAPEQEGGGLDSSSGLAEERSSAAIVLSRGVGHETWAGRVYGREETRRAGGCRSVGVRFSPG